VHGRMASAAFDANDPTRKWSVHRSSRGCDELIDDSSAVASSRLDGIVSSECLGGLEPHQPQAGRLLDRSTPVLWTITCHFQCAGETRYDALT
jgi:hypothetical protein